VISLELWSFINYITYLFTFNGTSYINLTDAATATATTNTTTIFGLHNWLTLPESFQGSPVANSSWELP